MYARLHVVYLISLFFRRLILAGATLSLFFLTPSTQAYGLMGEECHHVLDPTKPNPEMVPIETEIKTRVIGQNPAVTELVDAVSTALTGLQDPEKPIGRFIFLGPTGVGKTETAKAFVRALGGDHRKNLIKVDCGEYPNGHEMTKLIGAPPSYVGYGEPPIFAKDTLKEKAIPIKTPAGGTININVILFDEIEKAGATFHQLLLGILDDGKLTLGDGTALDLRNSIIILTSNEGAREVEAIIQGKRRQTEQTQVPSLPPYESTLDLTGRHDLDLRSRIKATYEAALKAKFKPEFLNRFQAIIQFLHLSEIEVALILDKELALLQQRIFRFAAIKVGLIVSPEAKKLLLDQGTDFLNGARELQRTLDHRLVNPLARIMASQQVENGELVSVGVDGETLTWTIVRKGLDEDGRRRFAEDTYPGFDFAPIIAEVGPEVSLTDYLNRSENRPILRRIFVNDQTHSVPVRTDAIGAGTATKMVAYVKVDDQLHSISFDRDLDRLEIVKVNQIPSALTAQFPVPQQSTWKSAWNGLTQTWQVEKQ